jgi:predicted DNA-binding transcriptional regulator AlpA
MESQRRYPTLYGTVAEVTPDVLVGIAEISQILGVSKNTALKYVQRSDFPAPIDRLATGSVWKRRDLDTWAAKTLPLPTGRPRKED